MIIECNFTLVAELHYTVKKTSTNSENNSLFPYEYISLCCTLVYVSQVLYIDFHASTALLASSCAVFSHGDAQCGSRRVSLSSKEPARRIDA